VWNVKSIHSNLLGPFDYTKAVKTTSLWLSEGVTDYYSYTLLARNDIITPKEFYSELEGIIRGNDASSSTKRSLEYLSLAESDFNMDNALAFYSKGTLVAMMLDIDIRNQSANKYSLDDAMHSLYAEAKKGKTFKDKELIGKIGKMTHTDLQDFYRRYIAGTDSLPIEEYLNKMALTKYATSGENEQELGVAAYMEPTTSKMIFFINTLDSTSFYFKSGLRQGDKLFALNGTEITMDNASELAKKAKDDVTMTITIGRDNERKEIIVTKSDDPKKKRKGIGELRSATSFQRAIRKALVGS
jgi:predicted metalloprotease with PDZ domain